MATVPDNFVPDVKPTPTAPHDYQDLNVNPDQFGGAIARGLQGLGGGVQKAEDFWVQTKTDQSLNNAYQKANDYVDYIKSLKGDDAIQAAAAAPSHLKQILDSEYDNLPTIGARVQFDNNARRFWYGRIEPDISGHIEQQRQAVAYGSAEDGYKQDTNFGATSKSPDELDHWIDSGVQSRIKMYQAHYGQNLDDTMRAQATQEGRAGIISAYVENRAVSDAPGAKAALDKYKDQLGAAYEPLYRKIEPMLNKGVADAYFNKLGLPPAGPGTGGAAPGQPQGQLASTGHIGVEPLADPGAPGATLSPNVGALADIVRSGESSNNYAVRFGGKNGPAAIDDLSRHPNIGEIIPEGMPHAGEQSTAAGAYGFIKSTWDEGAKATGVTDFEGPSQDRVFGYTAQTRYAQSTGGRDLEADLAAGKTDLVYKALSPTFSSLTPDKVKLLEQRLGADPNTPLSGQSAPPPQHMPDFDGAMVRAAGDLQNNPQIQGEVISRVARAKSMWKDATEQTRQTLAESLPVLRQQAAEGVENLPPFPTAAAYQSYPPVMAQRLEREDAVARQVGQVSRNLKYATPGELTKISAEIDSGQGVYSQMLNLNKKGATTGPGTEGADPDAQSDMSVWVKPAMRRQLDKLIIDRNNALFGPPGEPGKADPAMYMRDAPSVKAAWAQVDPKDPETYANYAKAMLASQTTMGLMPDERHVMDKGTAMQQVAKITDPTNDDPQAVFQQMQKSVGSAWPQVYHDLVSIGGLPGQYEAFENLNSIKAKLLSQSLAFGRPKADGKPSTTWAEALGEGKDAGDLTATKINDGVTADSRVADLRTIWAQSGASADQIDGRIAGMATLAMGERLFNKSTSPVDDAINAYTENYKILPDQNVAIDMMNPQTRQIEPMRAVNTEANMRAFVDRATIWDVQPPVFQGDKRLYPTPLDYVNALKTTPVWKNSKDGQGVVLFDGFNRAVTDRQGIPIQIRFDAPPPADTYSAPAEAPNQVD